VLSDLLLRLRTVFRRAVVDREIDEELRFHLDRQIESYRKAGLDDAEAAAAHDSNSVASTSSKKNIATRSEFGSLTISGAI